MQRKYTVNMMVPTTEKKTTTTTVECQEDIYIAIYIFLIEGL